MIIAGGNSSCSQNRRLSSYYSSCCILAFTCNLQDAKFILSDSIIKYKMYISKLKQNLQQSAADQI